MSTASERAPGWGCGEVSISAQAKLCAQGFACAVASSLAFARRANHRGDVGPSVGQHDDRGRTAAPAYRKRVRLRRSSRWPLNVPPPPGIMARQRLARVSEQVGGSKRSALLLLKAMTATRSRRAA